MKSIGIVVCNYNKQEDIINCIQSIFASTINDFDVFVVDNASVDDSVQRIQENFGDRVTLLVNQENLGGSGGFNTGLREALKHDYAYLMCVDNDVVLAPDAIEKLKEFLQAHPDTGMVGSKVYFMDEPEKIWNFGGVIDFENFIQRDQHKNQIDVGQLPEVVYGDYVPACSMMVRADIVREIGVMPEENFIYWDDMEWGYRFRQAGYRVAAYGQAKTWHKAGGRNAGNTFIHYYMWRNRLHFFRNVLPREQRERFAEVILDEMFRMIYSVNLKGETNIVKTLMYAFDDAVHGIRGKAAEDKILPRPSTSNRVQSALNEKKSVLIRFDGNIEGLGNIVVKLNHSCPELKVAIAVSDEEQCKYIRQQYPTYTIEAEYCPEQYDAHLVMCEHVFKLPADATEDVYIDSWCNIIYRPEDYVYCKSFAQTKELFVLCKKELLLREC